MYELVKPLVEQNQHITKAEREVYDKLQRTKKRRKELRDPVAAYDRRSQLMCEASPEAERLKRLTKGREIYHVVTPLGKLGVILGEAYPCGALINEIRDGSPLVGVGVGDRIVEIDGQDVSKMNMLAVKEIMRLKSGQQRHLVMNRGVFLTDVLESMKHCELKIELEARKLSVSGCNTMMKERIMESIARQGKFLVGVY